MLRPHVLYLRSMYKIDRTGGGSKNRSLGNYQFSPCLATGTKGQNVKKNYKNLNFEIQISTSQEDLSRTGTKNSLSLIWLNSPDNGLHFPWPGQSVTDVFTFAIFKPLSVITLIPPSPFDYFSPLHPSNSNQRSIELRFQ